MSIPEGSPSAGEQIIKGALIGAAITMIPGMNTPEVRYWRKVFTIIVAIVFCIGFWMASNSQDRVEDETSRLNQCVEQSDWVLSYEECAARLGIEW